MHRFNARLVSLIIFVALSVSTVLAQHMNEKDAPCRNLDTADSTRCLIRALKNSDAKLNTAYLEIRQVLERRPDDLSRLVKAQRAWIQYHDATCEAERDLYEGGTATWPAYYACMEALTRQRTHELRVSYVVALK